MGDFVVADVVPKDANGNWPDGLTDSDRTKINECYAWKRLASSDGRGGSRITRTMSDSIFSRTYRNLNSGAVRPIEYQIC